MEQQQGNKEQVKFEDLNETLVERLSQEVYQNALLQTMVKNKNKEIEELKKADK